jgi:hypothetical protein
MKFERRIYGEAEKLGWTISEEGNTDNIIQLRFSKRSPAGQDFSFEADYKDGDISSLSSSLRDYYEDFDVSSEAYLWLDKDGHGKNGAPYDMRDLYNDMEACENNVQKLFDAITDLEVENMYELTEKGIDKCKAFIKHCEDKRKEILDAGKDTVIQTNIPTVQEIEDDISSCGINDKEEYCEVWAVTDNYEADYPLQLVLGEDFIEW